MSIISHVKEIDALHFRPLKVGQVHAAKRVLQCEEGGAIVELENGSLVVVGSQSSVNRYAMVGFGSISGDNTTKIYTPSAAILRGLARLGVVTKAQVDAHIAFVAERAARIDRASNMQRVLDTCKELGVDPPAVPADIDLKDARRWF
jgi:hypothetical protein